MKILVVEDNDMNRDMLVRRLSRRGFEVSSAVDGQQAIDLTLSGKPDLVLMDMSLPVLDGWAATRHLRNLPDTANLPIIALTANATAEDREQALASGCSEYETKPIEMERLLEKIRRFIGE